LDDPPHVGTSIARQENGALKKIEDMREAGASMSIASF
jgi:hypothetical protein